MPVIALASGKGGVSKTTLAASLASFWRQQGHTVAAIDADPNAHLSRWIARMEIEGLVCPTTDEAGITRIAKEMARDYEIVVIDVAGVLSLGLAKAVMVADAILIPSKAGDGDTAEALRTFRTVEDLRGADVAARIAAAVLTQVAPQTTVYKHARSQLAADGVPTLENAMDSRVTYQEAWIRGVAPVAAGNRTLTADIEAIAAETLNLLKVRA